MDDDDDTKTEKTKKTLDEKMADFEDKEGGYSKCRKMQFALLAMSQKMEAEQVSIKTKKYKAPKPLQKDFEKCLKTIKELAGQLNTAVIRQSATTQMMKGLIGKAVAAQKNGASFIKKYKDLNKGA